LKDGISRRVELAVAADTQELCERLEQAVSGSPIVIFNTDLQLRTIWTHNLGLGLTPADVIGRAPNEVFAHPEEAAHYETLLRTVLETEAPLRAEITATLATSTRHYDLSLQPLTDAEGRLCGVTGLGIDITKRRRAEAALQEADRRKDEFIALLAHELRGPLAPIRNALALLLTGQQPSQAGEQLKLVDRQVSHMVRLVDDLLDLSRITADRIRLQPQAFNLLTLLDNLVFSARLMASPESIDVRFERGDSKVRVHADPARLGQVFANLLNNARKFTPPGGRITVRVERNDNWVSVSIIDTGIGIAPEHLQRVFERFEQLKGVREDPERGLGLGLYLARRLVQMHDGRIEVHSDGLNKGSEFRVTLPCLDAGQVKEEHQKQSDFFGHPLRVLVVDDHRDTALSLSMLLESWGHQTSCAHDGISGLEAAQASRPDVVILDIGMPRMNGFEMARRIREQPWGRSLRLMALSGFGQEQDLEQGRQAGIDAHLTKPADPARLRSLLTEWGEIAPSGMRH
jgi:PAS domain S-box-containing protein